jgi:hypothetical protein
VATAACLLLLTACTKPAHQAAPPVPVQSSSPAAAPTTVPPPVVSATVASSGPVEPVLPSGCSQLVSPGTLDHILGFGLLGQVTYLKAAPVPQSGRTGRVTCGYGTPNALPSGVVGGVAQPSASSTGPVTPLVEISYITYVDAKTALARVQATVEADSATAVVSNVKVDGKLASVLIGSQGTELVMNDAARTIVISLQPAVVPPPKAPAALEAIAASMLMFGAPVASGSPVSSAAAQASP